MAGAAQIAPQFSDVGKLQVGSCRLPLLAGALLCLSSAWYFSLVIAPSGLGANAPTVRQGLLPEWLGCREILRHRNPYEPEVTRRIEVAIYGKTVSAGSPANQHRFAYPVFFFFLFWPMALLPFNLAQFVMLVVCGWLSVMSVEWWADHGRRGKVDTVLITTLAFAAYPVVAGLQLRQPTLIIAALLAFSVSCAQSGRLALAAIAGALAVWKPHLAVAVLLPLSVWAITSWRTRKVFIFSLAASLLVLLLASELAVPGWLTSWLGTVRAYSHGERPADVHRLCGTLQRDASRTSVAGNACGQQSPPALEITPGLVA